jgi:hypothetical protein
MLIHLGNLSIQLITAKSSRTSRSRINRAKVFRAKVITANVETPKQPLAGQQKHLNLAKTFGGKKLIFEKGKKWSLPPKNKLAKDEKLSV